MRWLLPQPKGGYDPGGQEYLLAKIQTQATIRWAPSWVPLSEAHAAIGANPGAQVSERRQPLGDGGQEEVLIVWAETPREAVEGGVQDWTVTRGKWRRV